MSLLYLYNLQKQQHLKEHANLACFKLPCVNYIQDHHWILELKSRCHALRLENWQMCNYTWPSPPRSERQEAGPRRPQLVVHRHFSKSHNIAICVSPKHYIHLLQRDLLVLTVLLYFHEFLRESKPPWSGLIFMRSQIRESKCLSWYGAV